MNGTGTQQNVYLCNIVTTNLHIYALKRANSAVTPLINPLTLYHQTSCDLYKYTEVKISSYHTKLNTEQKFSCSLFSLYMKTKTRYKVFRYFHIWNKAAAPIRKLFRF